VHIRIHDVHAVFVREGRVRTLPGSYPAAAATELDIARLNPGGTETIQEVCLACDDAFVEVGIAEFAYVDLYREGVVSKTGLDMVGANTNAKLRACTRIAFGSV
jgi:hypothetical protein